MNKFVIVTEGNHDVAILKAILNLNENDNVEFFPAGGWSSADSYARSVLIHGDKKVALVLDADTTDPIMVQDKKKFLNRSLGDIASSAKWKVFMPEPAIEVLLFRDRRVIETLLRHSISEVDFVRASFAPKAVLKELFKGKNLQDIYDEDLRRLDLSQLREISLIKELMTFLKPKRNEVAHGKRASLVA